MKIKYFSDTDSVLIDFSDQPIAETRTLSENIFLELDARGNPVSMTIEHARINAQLPELIYQQIDQTSI